MVSRQTLYRGLVRLIPAPRYAKGLDGIRRTIAEVFTRHRVAGGSVAFFDPDRTLVRLSFGTAGKAGPVTDDTFFRIASLSKMVTALCVMRLAEDGLIAPDDDVDRFLPYPLRNPSYPDAPITLSMLLSHTSGLRDGESYHRGIQSQVPVDRVLAGDCWGNRAPGETWQYSNLGAGLVACVLEGALGLSFEDIMQRHLFLPLRVTASFYPQRIHGAMADAYRLIPPWEKVGFDAAGRKARPLVGADTPDPTRHYSLAQGNCITDMHGMMAIVRALMSPGYLEKETIARMRTPVAPFGSRSPYMQQGLGLFLVDQPQISPHTLYGHQGNAYGAMHGAFFDPQTGRGMVVMTTAASEAKTDFLADLNWDLLRLCFSSEAKADV